MNRLSHMSSGVASGRYSARPTISSDRSVSSDHFGAEAEFSATPYPKGILWTVVIGVVSFLNTRVLPSSARLNPHRVVARLQRGLDWCQEYLAEQDPGPQQFRGIAIDPTTVETSEPVDWTQVTYRGAAVQFQPTSVYHPWHQKMLSRWMLNMGLKDIDTLPPSQDPAPKYYRGVRL